MKRTLILILLLAILVLLPLLSSEALADFVGLGGSYTGFLNEPVGMFLIGVGMLISAGFFRRSVIRK